jgi:toxin YoeB
VNKIFSDKAWEDYQEWIKEDRKVVRRINELLRDIERGGHEGIGRPEPLVGDLYGYWSRRITQGHRLIYAIDDHGIYIAACRWHYERHE